MINQQGSLESSYKKHRRSIAGDSPENAELRQSFNTSRKHTEQAGKYLKTEQKH
jgi:hypothetical protein